MEQVDSKINMSRPAVFLIRIQGELEASWSDYFDTQSIEIEEDDAGNTVTVIVSKPMDQAALVGLVNHLNSLRIPLISVQYRQ